MPGCFRMVAETYYRQVVSLRSRTYHLNTKKLNPSQRKIVQYWRYWTIMKVLDEYLQRVRDSNLQSLHIC